MKNQGSIPGRGKRLFPRMHVPAPVSNQRLVEQVRVAKCSVEEATHPSLYTKRRQEFVEVCLRLTL